MKVLFFILFSVFLIGGPYLIAVLMAYAIHYFFVEKALQFVKTDFLALLMPILFYAMLELLIDNRQHFNAPIASAIIGVAVALLMIVWPFLPRHSLSFFSAVMIWGGLSAFAAWYLVPQKLMKLF